MRQARGRQAIVFVQTSQMRPSNHKLALGVRQNLIVVSIGDEAVLGNQVNPVGELPEARDVPREYQTSVIPQVVLDTQVGNPGDLLDVPHDEPTDFPPGCPG